MARSATPPERSRRSRRAGPAPVRLPARIDRDEVPALVARCLEEAAAGGPLTADCRDLVEAGMPAVEALARLALATARAARPFRLEGASPALLDLLRYCGLDEALRTEPDPTRPGARAARTAGRSARCRGRT